MKNTLDNSDNIETIPHSSKAPGNSGLKAALTVQKGESVPKVQVKKDGKSMGYADLEKMNVESLAQHEVTIVGYDLKFKKDDSVGDFVRYTCIISKPTEVKGLTPNEPAIKALDQICRFVLMCY